MDIKELKYRTDGKGARHFWELARLEVVHTLIRQLIGKKVTQAVNILDVGCGDLYVSGELSARIPFGRFYAADNALSEDDIVELNRSLPDNRIQVFNEVERITLNGNMKFDLVMILDVLEHIDDVDLMKSLRENPFTDERTFFIITVPAYQALFTSHDRFLGHERRYTRKTLRKSLETSGFEILRSNHFFLSLIIPRLLRVLLEKITRPGHEEDGGLGKRRGSRRLHAFLKHILLLDFRINLLMDRIRVKTPGLSIYAICRKHV